MDPITLFERAATRSAALARTITSEQRTSATPCSDWDVAALLDHMAGGASYLLAALSVEPDMTGAAWPAESVVQRCVDALRQPGALERTCMSPAGFEWSIAEAAAGTAMDQLIHTWDLAVATGKDTTMDAEAVDAIVAMFLPQMPEIGRQAGFVGPEIAIPPDAPAADRLLGAMGRSPVR